MTIDSGAAESVIPVNAIPEYIAVIHDDNIYYQTASGEIMVNEGEQRLPVITEYGDEIKSMTFQKCDVTKPLASVKKILEKGHAVVFAPSKRGGSYIMNLESQEVEDLVEEDGNYYLEVWIPPPEMMKEFEGFAGHP